MSAAMNDPIQEAMDEMQRQRERLLAARGKVKDLASKATSKDGMVTVTIGATGEVTSIAFQTQKFRKMAPVELGAVLVETIARARAESRDRAIAACRPLLPDGVDLENVLAGKTDLNRIFDDAIRKVSTIMTDLPRKG
jgi:DNA-binding protein YbaB